jgi:hypothetical protein
MRARTVLGLGIAAAVTLAGLFAIVSIVRFGSSLDGLNHLGDTEPELQPIPVSPSACAPLDAVRTAAAQAGDGWMSQLSADAAAWDAFVAQLGPELQLFADALRAAIPHVPAPLGERLQRVLRHVERGQRELPTSTDLNQYLAATGAAVFMGEQALAEASQLLGTACGPPLYERQTMIG